MNDPLITDARALLELREKATRGPWHVHLDDTSWVTISGQRRIACYSVSNSTFIASAHRMADCIASLLKELEACRADTVRLDWLIVGAGKEKAARVIGSDERGWAVCDCSNGLTFMSRGVPTYRAAIDAAISTKGQSHE